MLWAQIALAVVLFMLAIGFAYITAEETPDQRKKTAFGCMLVWLLFAVPCYFSGAFSLILK